MPSFFTSVLKLSALIFILGYLSGCAVVKSQPGSGHDFYGADFGFVKHINTGSYYSHDAELHLDLSEHSFELWETYSQQGVELNLYADQAVLTCAVEAKAMIDDLAEDFVKQHSAFGRSFKLELYAVDSGYTIKEQASNFYISTPHLVYVIPVDTNCSEYEQFSDWYNGFHYVYHELIHFQQFGAYTAGLVDGDWRPDNIESEAYDIGQCFSFGAMERLPQFKEVLGNHAVALVYTSEKTDVNTGELITQHYFSPVEIRQALEADFKVSDSFRENALSKARFMELNGSHLFQFPMADDHPVKQFCQEQQAATLERLKL